IPRRAVHAHEEAVRELVALDRGRRGVRQHVCVTGALPHRRAPAAVHNLVRAGRPQLAALYGNCRTSAGARDMTTGVVIGKFLPPHSGHRHLIEVAAAAVDHLDVIVCAHESQPIEGATRVAWLREIHPDVSVHLTPDDIPEDQAERTSQAWAARTVEVLGHAPDVGFTSEEDGPRY